MRGFATLLLVLAMIGAQGCASTGSVREKAPLTADLATYKSASVEVEVPEGMKNADTAKTQFQSQLGDKLRAKNLFSQVSPGGGDMTIRVRVVKVDGGDDLGKATNWGSDAEVSMNVDFVDAKQDKVVGTVHVTGDSKHLVKSGANGAEDTTATALGRAGDEIVAYLEKHRR